MQKKPDSKLFENPNEFSTEFVEIQFQLNTQNDASGVEKFVLEIIDDFTGLPYNSSFIELMPFSDQVYVTALTVPQGSVIKYRYAKLVQSSLIPEANASGEPIDYRMVYVPGDFIVTDILQCWQGDEVNDRFGGILQGVLLEWDTGLPIPDILVTVGGKRTVTDANGKFLLEDLGQGMHNVVFYAMDGKYRTFQQGANIQTGMITPAEVKLTRMPEVNITFVINQANDALGAPVYIAGNIFQLGNTFTVLNGGMTIKPMRMPALSSNEDGRLSITLRLYAETDLRYKFTLGDGYWNSDQYQTGGMRIRQLIVPSEDVTINHTIETWRSPGVEPITFSITIPPKSAPDDLKYIQFMTDRWTEPIPLWMLGNGQYLYILFSPLEMKQPINFRFCRMGDCLRVQDIETLSDERQVTPSHEAQTISLTLDQWQNWTNYEKNAFVQEAYIPQKLSNFRTIIEFTDEMSPSWQAHFPQALSTLNTTGVDTLIFSPIWKVSSQSPYLQPQMGLTPYVSELLFLINSAKNRGFSTALHPHLGPFYLLEDWWLSKPHQDVWWNEFFSSYRDFLYNYATLAEISGIETLILGGKSISPAFEGGLLPDGRESDIPTGFDHYWHEILSDIREAYSGEIFWATHVNLESDPLPDFVDEFDGLYISVDSPIGHGDETTFNVIQSGFTDIIDSQIYEAYRAHQLPITVAIAYPSVAAA
ncbi:MAG: hypothetical protein GX142_02815, partial [Chloroflexi bacterium]|nr:hypothetical protein [Chloroflexota bacterium]